LDCLKGFLYKYFSWSGRIGRKSFIIRFLLSILLIGLVLPIFHYLLQVSFYFRLIIFVIILLFFLASTIKRLHDIEMPWYGSLFVLGTGPLSIICIFLLGTIAGTVGENKYGSDPLSNWGESEK